MGWYVLDKACDDETTRNEGFTVVEDLSGVSMSFMSSAFPSLPEEVMLGIMGSVPARLRAIYACHQPWFADNAVYMAKSTFMPTKLANKIHMCGADVTAVHARVAPDQLPTEFGGSRD